MSSAPVMKPVTTGMEGLPAARKMATMSTTPATKFMNAPATRMMSFFHHALLLKARGSLEDSPSPSMAQKPPMGKALSV